MTDFDGDPGRQHTGPCDHGCQRPESDGEAAFAHFIIAGGDLRHAAAQVADAVAADPMLPETYECWRS